MKIPEAALRNRDALRVGVSRLCAPPRRARERGCEQPPRKLRRVPQGEPVASGEFSSEQGGDEMRIEFSKPAKGRYLKLECLGEWRGRAYCAIAELSALVE